MVVQYCTRCMMEADAVYVLEELASSEGRSISDLTKMLDDGKHDTLKKRAREYAEERLEEIKKKQEE